MEVFEADDLLRQSLLSLLFLLFLIFENMPFL